jgi:Spy/CpxP family protein refolding chaperone
MKKMIVGLMVVALVATAGLAMAQGWGRGMGYGYGPGPGYGPGYGMGYGPRGSWGPALNLTPEQEKILAKQKEIDALRTQLQEKATKNRLEMRKVLTPEQQAQLGADGPGFGPGYGMRGGFGPGRGYGYGYCPRW